MATLKLKSVADRLGISPHTLRAWEKRYGAVKPGRSESGRRVYSHEEVQRLILLGELVKKGHSISQIAQLSDKKLSSLSSKQSVIEDRIQEPFSPTPREHLEAMLDALHEFKLEGLGRQLDWASLSLGCREFILDVVVPLMREVGLLVLDKKMSISQEHALSSLLRSHFSGVLKVLQNHQTTLGSNYTGSFLLTTPEGDQHEFGILLGAALCANMGVPAFYLGPSMPAKDIVESVGRLKSSVVVLGNLPTSESSREKELREFFKSLDQRLPASVEVWIGGAALPLASPFASGRKVEILSSLVDFEEKIFRWKNYPTNKRQR